MNSPLQTLFLSLVAATLGLAFTGCDTATHERSADQSITSMSLDDQNLQNAAREIAQKIQTTPHVQEVIARIKAANGGRPPRLLVDKIENRSGVHLNMVEYIVVPMQETFTNSGVFEFESANQTAVAEVGMNEAEGHRDPTRHDLLLDGVVSLNSTHDNGVDQNSYTFHVDLTDLRTNAIIFTSTTKTLPKQKKQSSFGF